MGQMSVRRRCLLFGVSVIRGSTVYILLYIFVGHCLVTKVFIGKLPAM